MKGRKEGGYLKIGPLRSPVTKRNKITETKGYRNTKQREYIKTITMALDASTTYVVVCFMLHVMRNKINTTTTPLKCSSVGGGLD